MDYESIANQLENLRLEQDKDFARSFLEELRCKLNNWSPLVRRKYNLDEAERSRIINVDIPQLEEELAKSYQKKASSKSKNKEDTDPNYNDYCYEDDEDDEQSNPTWKDLNPDNLPYAEWLAEVGLPRFFPFPDPILYKVAASICLINSAALPGLMRSLSLQAELPLVICYGLPNVGKSTFCNWVGYHYLENPQLADEYSPFQVVKDDTSYKGLRDAFDKACRFDDDDKLREAAAHIDDFEPRLLLSDGLWGRSRGIFIAIQRSQATSRISINGSSADVQGKFYYWLLKLLSTNNHPKELFSALPKMERRCLILPFESISAKDNLGNYDWSVVRKEYVSLWNKKDRDEIFWKGLLRPQLKRPFSDFKSLPQEVVARSITIISVGTYAGIWKSIEEAEEALTEYWEFINSKCQEGYQDFLLIALEDYISDRESATITGISRLDGKRVRRCTVSLSELLEKCSQSPNRDRESQRIISFMTLKGYRAINPVLGGRHTPSFEKELE